MQTGPAPLHVWLDGAVLPVSEARIPVTDRGFQLGDAVFETLRARRGVVIELADHLARLRESTAALQIPLPDDPHELARGIAELLATEGLDADGADGTEPADAALRITVSRGPLAGRGMLPTGWRDARPTIAIQAWPHLPPPAAVLERGLRAITSTVRHDPTSPLAGAKTTSRAAHVYGRLEAERRDADEAIFLTVDGLVAEATSANVFVIAGDDLATPARSSGILAGTTRGWLLGHAAAEGLRPVERDLRPDDLLGAGEAFLSSSVAGIMPLVSFDRRPIGTGRPGPRTMALRAAREHWIDERSRLDPVAG
jgi:branched-chain amino acid aminotransferase